MSAESESREKAEPARCDACGDEAAIEVDGTAFCAGCYHICGSCCAGDE